MHDEPSTCSGRTPNCGDANCSISFGSCHCGCGGQAPIAGKTTTREGYVRGLPKKWISGHNSKVTGGFTQEGRAKIRAALIGKTHSEDARAKIRAARARQVGNKTPGWKGDKAQMPAFHAWLNRKYPRIGRCEHCGQTEKPTEYASLTLHRYTRNREDYAELCRPCHRRMDYYNGQAKTRGRTVA